MGKLLHVVVEHKRTHVTRQLLLVATGNVVHHRATRQRAHLER